MTLSLKEFIILGWVWIWAELIKKQNEIHESIVIGKYPLWQMKKKKTYEEGPL